MIVIYIKLIHMGVVRGGHGAMAPQWAKILKEIGPYVGRCLAAAHMWPLPIKNPGYAPGGGKNKNEAKTYGEIIGFETTFAKSSNIVLLDNERFRPHVLHIKIRK